MQGRLENQIKAERQIEKLLSDMPKVVSDYYLTFSASREFRTCLGYIQKIRKFLVWYAEDKGIELKNIDCKKISDLDCAKYMKNIETKNSKDGDTVYTSFSYRKQNWSILNSFFSYMQKKSLRENNPMILIDYPNKNDKVQHVFLQKDNLDELIQAVVNGAGSERSVNRQDKWKDRDLAIVYTLILTGMRESALCEMNIDSIDFENNIIEVIDKEHKVNTYSIPGKLKKLLEKWLEKRNELLEDRNCDALFISNQRKRINQHTVIHIVNKYSEEAFGYKVSPHRLRAAYGNMIYKATGDIHLTSRAMKHNQISTTQIYMESDENEVNKKVVDILGGVF